MSIIAIGATTSIGAITTGAETLGTFVSATGIGAVVIGAVGAGIKLGNLIGDLIESAKNKKLNELKVDFNNGLQVEQNLAKLYASFGQDFIDAYGVVKDILDNVSNYTRIFDRIDRHFVGFKTSIISIINSFSNLFNYYIPLWEQLYKVWTSTTKIFDYDTHGLTLSQGIQFAQPYNPRLRINDFLTLLKNLGIVEDGWEVYTQYIGYGMSSSAPEASYWVRNLKVANGQQITSLIDLIKNISNFIKNVLSVIGAFSKKVDIIEFTPIISGSKLQLPPQSMNIASVISPSIPRVFGGVDEETTESEIYGVLSKLYGSTLARMIMNSIRTGTASISITRTISEEFAEEEDKKKKRKKIPRKKKKRLPKRFKYAERNVSNHSEWIEKISFEFPVDKDYQSNDRGTLIFHLKKGKQIKRVRVARGTFSFIVYALTFVPYGVGYRFWSHFNRKYLVNPNTISIGLRMISNSDRQRAIPKELTDKHVKYKN